MGLGLRFRKVPKNSRNGHNVVFSKKNPGQARPGFCTTLSKTAAEFWKNHFSRARCHSKEWDDTLGRYKSDIALRSVLREYEDGGVCQHTWQKHLASDGR